MSNQYINRVNGIPIQDTELKNNVIEKTNTKEYTPTGDYNPATKKYVDDKISSSTAGTIDETDLDTILTDIYGFTDTTK